MVCGSIHLYLKEKEQKIQHRVLQGVFNSRDIIIAIILTTIIGTFYFSIDISHPQKSEIDEVDTPIKALVFSRPGFDIFRPTEFYDFPAPVFSIAGRIAERIGSIDAFNLRIIHISITLLSIFAAYFLFCRIFTDRFLASAATLILAGSHNLFAQSRIGHLINSAVLIEVVSLTLLFIGLQRRSMLFSFIGGIIAALGWVVYGTAKVVIVIWILSLIVLFICSKLKVLEKIEMGRIIPATIVGFSIALLPFIVGSLTLPDDRPVTNNKTKKEIMLFSQGREEQMRAIDTDTFWEAYKFNIVNGLTAFNTVNKLNGQKFALTHYHPLTHFVDPLTGVFLWFGVLITALAILKRRMKNAEMVIVLTCFLSLLFAFSFLITTAPNWPRLLITLPFVVSLALFGIHRVVAHLITHLPPIKLSPTTIEKLGTGTIVVVILYINISTVTGVNGYITSYSFDDYPITGSAHYIHTQVKQHPYLYLYDTNTKNHYRKRWNANDWWGLWFNTLTVSHNPFVVDDFTIREYFSYRKGGGRDREMWFGKRREPIRNTVNYTVNHMKKAPRHYHMIKRSSDSSEHPEEFRNTHDWNVWLNLFIALEQSFQVVEPEYFLTEKYTLPATFFVTEDAWKDIKWKIPKNLTVTTQYLSSYKNILIIEVEPMENDI